MEVLAFAASCGAVATVHDLWIALIMRARHMPVGLYHRLGMVLSLIALVCCSRDRTNSSSEINSYQIRAEASPTSSAGSALNAPPRAPAAPEDCPSILPPVDFIACNAHPRFRSIPDCFSYSLTPTRSTASGPCEPKVVDFSVAGPQVTDELRVEIEIEPGGHERGLERHRLTLKAVIGSMMDKFRHQPGTKVGTVVVRNGAPTELILGPALLPSEIGVKRAEVDLE